MRDRQPNGISTTLRVPDTHANAYGVRHAHANAFSHKHNDSRRPVARVITASYPLAIGMVR